MNTVRLICALLPVLLAAEQVAWAAKIESFALIVTNNRSIDLGRPELKYADDDGAKYYELFRMIAPVENISVLGSFDSDTRRLFPKVAKAAKAATRKGIVAAAKRLAGRVRQAKQRGHHVAFYFVFAGHGDVDKGRGFLELEDGPFYAEELEKKILKAIPAKHIHVILDSCNSFFVINPRKPGGRRFATPKDVIERLSRRLPNVGVFLSTSAEAEVFEWSELQSGIFSHAVRSGIVGGADVNNDGRVSYRELEAFVNVAASKVRNPLYRPKVFARGPGGKDSQALVDLGRARADKLKLNSGKQLRLSVRDNDGLRWIDVHKERGATVELRLPARLKDKFVAEELPADRRGAVVARQYEAPPEQPEPVTLALASLPTADGAHEARGASDLFRMLYTQPFGPIAYKAYAKGREKQELPVFGISRDDTERMKLFLGEIASLDRHSRIGGFLTAVLGGGLFAGMGAWAFTQKDESPYEQESTLNALGWSMIGIGTAFAGFGTYLLVSKSRGEVAYDEFVQAVSKPGANAAKIVAQAEARLEKVLERERLMRRTAQVMAWVVAGMGGLITILNETKGRGSDFSRLMPRFYGPMMMVAGAGSAISMHFIKSPSERMIRIWREDPGIKRLPRISLSPIRGGAIAGLSGRF